MPYDAGLDKEVFSKSVENEMGRLTVKVMSYNDGAKKLQISREKRGAEEIYKFSKLGRLAKDELESILPLIQEAKEQM
ncbi:MAG: hypothetical protein KKH08_06215 [Candidatus Omnitrophica bacterium]|nr:hypothetical protein [Candidatus Omnitrophota bacterium]